MSRNTPRKLSSQSNGRPGSPSRLSKRPPPPQDPSPLAQSLDDDDDLQGMGMDMAGMGQFSSLAHELAAAIEPSSFNSSLAEELGLDFDGGDDDDEEVEDEAAEPSSGISDPVVDASPLRNGVSATHRRTPSTASASASSNDGTIILDRSSLAGDDASSSALPTPDSDRRFSRPQNPMSRALRDDHSISPTKGGEEDIEEEGLLPEEPLEQLARELAITDAFILKLKRLDTITTATDTIPSTPADAPSHHHFIPTSSATSSTYQEPPIERYTSRMIRQLNDTIRERENQLRELLTIDKEFRKIEGELGGKDAIGALDALDDGDSEGAFFRVYGEDSLALGAVEESAARSGHLRPLGGIEEEDEDDEFGHQQEEVEEDEEEDVFSAPPSPTTYTHSRRGGGPRGSRSRNNTESTSALPPSPSPLPPNAPITPSSTLPYLSHLRALTSSLTSTLSSMSEHTQEAHAATADAGRKIRAMKNRVVGWTADAESAERSREKIALWESEGEGKGREDGRVVVKREMEAFERALGEASVKTKAIMAS